jgi:hypothetical protein
MAGICRLEWYSEKVKPNGGALHDGRRREEEEEEKEEEAMVVGKKSER